MSVVNSRIISVIILILFIFSISSKQVLATSSAIDKTADDYNVHEIINVPIATDVVYKLNLKPGQKVYSYVSIKGIPSDTKPVLANIGMKGAITVSFTNTPYGDSHSYLGEKGVDFIEFNSRKPNKTSANTVEWMYEHDKHDVNISYDPNEFGKSYQKEEVYLLIQNYISAGRDVKGEFSIEVNIVKSRPFSMFYLCTYPNFILRILAKLSSNNKCGIDFDTKSMSEMNVKSRIDSKRIAENAINIASILSKPNWERLITTMEQNPSNYRNNYCKFKYEPFDNHLPFEIQDVYSWSSNWNPKNYPENYIECTTFVHMTFNMTGISFKNEKLGDPISWIKRDDLFNVYEDEKTAELPQIGDIMIWDSTVDNKHGHVGIVTRIDNGINNSKFTVTNANSTKISHQFLIIKKNNLVEMDKFILWKPKYWLRIKN